MQLYTHIGCLGENCPICPKLDLPEYEEVKANLGAIRLSPLLQKAEPPSLTDQKRFSPPCIHRQEHTGNKIQCPSCRGHVELKVFGCDIHSSCVLDKQVPEIQCCATCKDREPLEIRKRSDG